MGFLWAADVWVAWEREVMGFETRSWCWGWSFVKGIEAGAALGLMSRSLDSIRDRRKE